MNAEIDTKTAQVVWRGARSDQNVAVYQLLGGTAVSTGLDGLYGCTSLVIVSRLGWYFTHWWESISFDPDPQWGFTDATDALQRSVLDPLVRGAGRGLTPAHPSLSAAGGTFSGSSVRAFLVIPSRSYSGDRRGYRTAWDSIKNTVGSIVPDLDPGQHNDRWQEITCRRLESNNPALDESAAGHVLVKYDPDDPAGSGQQRLALWVERDKVYEDRW